MLSFSHVSSFFLTREELFIFSLFLFLTASFPRFAVTDKLKITASEHLCKLLFAHDRLLRQYSRIGIHYIVVMVTAGGEDITGIILCKLSCNTVMVFLKGMSVPDLDPVENEFLRYRAVSSEGMRLNEHAAVIADKRRRPILILQINVRTAVVKLFLKTVHKIIRTECALKIDLGTHKDVEPAPRRLLYHSVPLYEIFHLLGQGSVLYMLKRTLGKMLRYYDRSISSCQIRFNYSLGVMSRTAAHVSRVTMKLRFIFIHSTSLHIYYCTSIISLPLPLVNTEALFAIAKATFILYNI